MKTFELNRAGIRKASYDPEQQRLEIEFLRGPRYRYDAVPESVVQWLVRTKDPASYLKRVITPGFAYRRLDKSRPAASVDLEGQLRASLEGVQKRTS
jgi:hypothetical protein